MDQFCLRFAVVSHFTALFSLRQSTRNHNLKRYCFPSNQTRHCSKFLRVWDFHLWNLQYLGNGLGSFCLTEFEFIKNWHLRNFNRRNFIRGNLGRNMFCYNALYFQLWQAVGKSICWLFVKASKEKKGWPSNHKAFH